MLEFLKKRWVLFAVLIVFIICKIPHLYYAYYWDESWVYAPAVKEMYHNGISLLPNAISEYYSRGHPLLFHALAALWMHIFGGSHLALHSFALFLSLCLFVAIYEVGLRLFNPWVAILSLIITVTQVDIFVQSSFLLFELFLALLAFLSFYFYVRDKYFLAALFLTMLFLTKETGLLAGVVIGLDAFIGLFRRKTEMKTRLLRLIPIAASGLIIISFFICQKAMKGWYLFPSHMDSFLTQWGMYMFRFRWCALLDVYLLNLRNYLFLMPVLIFILAAIKTRKLKWLFILLPAILAFLLIDDHRAAWYYKINDHMVFILFLISYFVMAWQFSAFYINPAQRRFIILTSVFIMCYVCFSAALTYTVRYIFAALIPMIFLLAVMLDLGIRNLSKIVYYPVLAGILVVAWFSFTTNEDHGDVGLGAFKAMDVQQRMVNFLEQNNFYDKSIGAGSFLAQVHLTVPNSGFLKSDKVFTNVGGDINPKTQVILFDNIEPDPRYDAIKADTNFRMINRITNDNIWCEVFQNKR